MTRRFAVSVDGSSRNGKSAHRVGFPEPCTGSLAAATPDCLATTTDQQSDWGQYGLHRRVFDSVGGFSAGLGRIGNNSLGCEETELCIRYSAAFPDDRFVLRRDAIVHHHVPSSRLTWHYFWTRCWAEGLSKAAVGALVGSEQGLSAERAHALQAMPRELRATFAMVAKQPRDAFLRAGYIVAGSLLALGGLLRGRLALRSGGLRSTTS